MLNETRLEGIALSAAESAVNALIETQVILQLLVQKNIVTPEEVIAMREVVRRQPKYKKMLYVLDNSMNEVNESAKFQDLLEKSLQPDGKNNLTPEEKEYVLSRIDSSIKSMGEQYRSSDNYKKK